MSETTLIKVKTERPDEAEIRELAAKMVEANKAKALAASVAAARAPNGLVPPGAGGILNFLTRKTPAVAAAAAADTRPAVDPDKKTPAPDEASWKGHFGWDMLGKCHIPFIFRSAEKYVAVRMVEIKLLNKYLNYLHGDIYSCTCIRSYYITEVEARLLNEINNRHCDSQFGRDLFTQKDLVVRLSDAYEFYNFLDVCYNKLLRGTTNTKDKCGFIRINKESVVPYTVRDNQKFVPLFYFEGETENLKLKADQLKGWDLSYLKFCCKVQGIRNELFASETCSVISLADIKSYFPPGTDFEEYWPNKVVDSQLLISAKGAVSGGGQWTRAPPAPPPGTGSAGAASASLNSQPRGRRTGSRHSPAAAAMQIPHAALSAATVQAIANGWSVPPGLTHAQTQQVLRLAQAQAQAQAARYNNAMAAAAAVTMPQLRSQHGRNIQFPNSAITMAMAQQQPPPLVRSTANTSTMNTMEPDVQIPSTSSTPMETEDIVPPTSAIPFAVPHTPHNAKAQRQSMYRKRKAAERTPAEAADFAKAAAERQRRCKQRRLANSALDTGTLESATVSTPVVVERTVTAQTSAQTSAQRQRAYRQRRAAQIVSQISTPPTHTAVQPEQSTWNIKCSSPQMSGSMNGHSASHSVDTRKRLTPIPDINITGNHTPYKVQKALVENTMVPCINAKPYQYTELLMTLPDLASHYFPRVSLTTCRAMLDALGLTLYRPNATQLQVLRNSGKCKSAAAGENGLALVQIRDVMQHMPQFKYMLRAGLAGDDTAPPPAPRPAHMPPPSTKRARAN